MRVWIEERETSFAAWFNKGKPCGGGLDRTAVTRESFMHMPFVHSYEEVLCKGLSALSTTQLYASALGPKAVTQDLCRVVFNLREEWFLENNMYLAKKIDFEIRFWPNKEK